MLAASNRPRMPAWTRSSRSTCTGRFSCTRTAMAFTSGKMLQHHAVAARQLGGLRARRARMREECGEWRCPSASPEAARAAGWSARRGAAAPIERYRRGRGSRALVTHRHHLLALPCFPLPTLKKNARPRPLLRRSPGADLLRQRSCVMSEKPYTAAAGCQVVPKFQRGWAASYQNGTAKADTLPN